MQPLQYDLRGPAAKTIVFRTQPRRQATLTQQITVRSAETELQNTIESQERRRKRGLNWQLHCGADPRMIPNERVPQPPAGQASPSIFRGTFFCPAIKTQNFVHLLTFRNPFRARLPLKSENGRCENKAFLRDFPPKVKMKERCENEAFVRDFPQRVKGEDAKARLSCETSLKK